MNPNFRSGYLEQGAPLGAVTQYVNLVADNTVINVMNPMTSLLSIQSNDTTAGNRTFTITSSTLVGHQLAIIFTSGASTSAQLADSGNCQLNGAWEPLQYQMLSLQWNGTYWVEVSRSNPTVSSPSLTSGQIIVGNASNEPTAVDMTGDIAISNAGVTSIAAGAIVNADVSGSAAIAFTKLATLTSGNILVGNGSNAAASVAMSGDATLSNAGVLSLATDILVEATGTLTQANIVAMNGAPVTLIAAPAAGNAIIVDEIELFHDYAVAAYSSGGDVSIEYATTGTDVMILDETFVTAGADGSTLVKPTVYTSTATDTGFDLAANVAKAIQVTNATGAFADGDVGNIIKWRIRYHVVTVLA